MLHDYELALSNYRLLSRDYNIDKAWKRYDGVQEMIGFSLFMLDQSRKEAANVYFRIPSEEPSLRAGILLEQAAYCYLRANPPMLRKFGFHLVLAGNRYTICGQRKHAIRAYMSVLPIFEGMDGTISETMFILISKGGMLFSENQTWLFNI